MREQYPQHAVPIALLATDSGYYRSGVDEAERTRVLRAALKREHAFHWRAPSYLRAPMDAWLQLAAQLAPEDRNFGAMVLPNQPVHYYADIDGGFAWCLPAAETARACCNEFEARFQTTFRRCFGRAPDLSGMHWEQALGHARKLSLHVHLTTEAFATLADLRAFDIGFRAYLAEHPDRAASALCRGADECLVDASAYTPNRVMRLGGNCKRRGHPRQLPLGQRLVRGQVRARCAVRARQQPHRVYARRLRMAHSAMSAPHVRACPGASPVAEFCC